MRNPFFVVLAAALAASACSDSDDGPGGAGGSAGMGGAAGSGGTVDVLDVPAGEARAGQLAIDQLPQDDNGLARYSEGDFALVNENIAVIIEDAEPSDLYAPFGGGVVGIARFDNGALVDAGDFNEVMIGLRRFLVNADSVTVANDGTDGMAAVVQVQGKLVALPFLEDLLGGTIAGNLLVGTPPPSDETFQATTATVEFELAPGAEHVDVFYTVDQDLDPLRPSYVLIQSRRMATYVPGVGFGVGDITLDFEYVAFIDEGGVSYALEDRGGPMNSSFGDVASFGLTDPEISGVLPLRGTELNFTAGTRVPVLRLHVGGTGLDGLRSAIARTNGTATRTITGTVRSAAGAAAPGIRVHAETPDPDAIHITRTLTDDAGNYSLTVPDGVDVQLRAFGRGDGITAPQLVAAATSTADIDLAARGTIRVVATEDGTGIPVRVQVIPDASGFQPPSNYGEPFVPLSDRLHVVFPIDGDVTLSAPVGGHRVVVSRGYEYDIVDTNISVTEDNETMVPAALTRVVDTSGVMCGDFHIHTNRSPDSPDSAEFKLRSAAGDGVELPVRTDHEFVAEFETGVVDLGLGGLMYGLSSLELTTFSWGHFGVFPLEPDPTMVNDGAVAWSRVDPSGGVEILRPVEVFNDARSRPGSPKIIIFHPRDKPGSGGGFGAISGGSYFVGMGAGFLATTVNTGGVGYDPVTDTVSGNGKPGFTAGEPDFDPAPWWDTEFTTVEVFNDSSFEENKQNALRIVGGEDLTAEIGTVDDWFGLLNSVERDGVFAVGSSDSHSVMRGSPVGYPRTCIFTGTDDPTVLRADSNTPQMIKTLVSGGRTVIDGGFYVTATSGATGPGQTVSGAGPYTVDLSVQAPMWVGDMALLEMWVSDGTTISSTTIALGAEPTVDQGDVLRFPAVGMEGAASVMVPAGSKWVVFHARGEYDPTIGSPSGQPQTLAPVHPGRLPFGVTNPIFFEEP